MFSMHNEIYFVFTLKTGNPITGTFIENSEYPDEMTHNAAFRQGLQCLLRQNQYSDQKRNIFFEIITFDTSIYTMDHPDLKFKLYGKFHWEKTG